MEVNAAVAQYFSLRGDEPKTDGRKVKAGSNINGDF